MPDNFEGARGEDMLKENWKCELLERIEWNETRKKLVGRFYSAHLNAKRSFSLHTNKKSLGKSIHSRVSGSLFLSLLLRL